MIKIFSFAIIFLIVVPTVLIGLAMMISESTDERTSK
jgi:hypothetical protein